MVITCSIFLFILSLFIVSSINFTQSFTIKVTIIYIKKSAIKVLFFRSPNRDRRRHDYRRRSPVSPRRHRSRSAERDTKNDIERLDPAPSKVLGIFGLAPSTDEATLRDIYSKYGKITSINVVYDRGVSFYNNTCVTDILNQFCFRRVDLVVSDLFISIN